MGRELQGREKTEVWKPDVAQGPGPPKEKPVVQRMWWQWERRPILAITKDSHKKYGPFQMPNPAHWDVFIINQVSSIFCGSHLQIIKSLQITLNKLGRIKMLSPKYLAGRKIRLNMKWNFMIFQLIMKLLGDLMIMKISTLSPKLPYFCLSVDLS